MTDISGNFSVNAHSYNKEIAPEKACDCEKCNTENKQVAKSETDLDKSPQALNGRAMVKKSGAKHDKYQFKPELVNQDVEELDIMLHFATSLFNDYKAKGLSNEQAMARTLEAVDILQSGAFPKGA